MLTVVSEISRIRGPDIVVGIPTFRRPIWLLRCLRSIESLNFDHPIRVVVADNDPDLCEGKAVCDQLKKDGYAHELISFAVSERGLSANRNALVRAALSDPDVKFLAMIDDDEWAHPDWLSGLMAVQREYDADVVGGPVEKIFEVPVPPHMAKPNPAIASLQTGIVDLLHATNNIIFKTELFRNKPYPWFDPLFSLMGGEDKDLLLGLQLEGKRFAWASKAIVTEELPRSRCSTKWLIQREYRAGNTDTIVNLKRRPPGFSVPLELGKIFAAVALSALKLVVFSWEADRRFRAIRLGARAIGKLRALMGSRYEEYSSTHGR